MMKRYLPMLSRPAAGPFTSDDWLFEIKWDGVRAIAYVNSSVSLLSRNSVELFPQFPELGELTHLAPGTVLDGEIVAMREGKPDIQSLLSRVQAGSGRLPPSLRAVPVTYIVFDILEHEGKSLLDLPLTERRKILESSVREGPHVIISVPVENRGEDYYRLAVEQGLEGVMAKKKESRYEPGIRSGAWLKIKDEKSCDCVIAGYTPGQGGRGTVFGALVLGLYETKTKARGKAGTQGRSRGSPEAQAAGGRMTYIGKVGTGFSDRDLAGLMAVFSAHVTTQPQLDVDPGEQIVWLEPFFVCEVAYMRLTRESKLRIPRFIRMRPDKRPEECTTEQLNDVKVKLTPGQPGPSAEEDTPGTRPDPGNGKKSQAAKQMAADVKNRREGSMKKYLEKRDFEKTSEPSGTAAITGKGNYFVIHEHHASHLHFDLRLEREGVLKSWAVPKGIPEVPGEKHLAVQVEDHPLEYGHFEGEIPKGEYGAGTVSIWDNGTYDTKHWDENKVEITFHGKRLSGNYVLIRFKRAGKNEWLVFRPG